MKQAEIEIGKSYSNGHPVGSRYRTVRKVLEIVYGRAPLGESEGWNVRYLCLEGTRDVKGREGIITLQAFASWAKEVVEEGV